MKKIFLFLIIFLLNQDLYTQNINYHFLDSNLVEVILKKTDKISYNERKKVYYYVEYELDENNYVDNFKIFYAEGSYPEHSEEDGKEITYNKKPYISFSDPKLRKGKLYSYIEISPKKGPISFDYECVKSLDTTCYKFIYVDRFFSNGNRINDRVYYNNYFDVIKTGEYQQNKKNKEINYYTPKGKLKLTEFYENGKVVKAIKQIPNDAGEYVYYIKNDTITHALQYENGKKIAKFHFKNNVYDKSQDEYFSLSGIKLFNFSNTFTENNVKKYFDSRNDLRPLEGLYTVTSKADAQLSYKIAVLLDKNDMLLGHLLAWNCYNHKAWQIGEAKATFEEIAVDGFYKVTWLNDYKYQEVNDVIEDKTSGALLTFGNYNMIKLYPKFSQSKPTTSSEKPTDSWKGNGSGLVISKSGYIVTNHHVTKNASSIEVEFKYKNSIVSFNALVIKEDVINDLSIIKIEDKRFSGFSSIPYSYKSSNVDVGTKIYAYGYPMALEIMGKEVKITDGIISSKTGYQGDITKYQISAPIQGGNSGGPLFDKYANLIGINSSGLKKYISDNVGYSIKVSYLKNLIDVLPEKIQLPSDSRLAYQPLTEQIKVLSDYVVLIKVK